MDIATFQAKEAKRFKLKTGVFALIMQDEKILLLRRYQTGTQDGMYVVPMGGHDGKEPLTHSVIREAKEEVNIDVLPEALEVCHVMHRYHPMPYGLSFEQVDVFFRINKFSGTIHNNEPGSCDELTFYAKDNLPENTAPFIKHALECIDRGQFYSEFGWNEQCEGLH